MWRALCVLALLSLHSLPLQSADLLIFCDDPTVFKAVTSAINKFNEEMFTGHKLALSQVMSAAKEENGLYVLRFTARRSDCPATDPRTWTDCDYLPTDKKPTDCNATVHMNETDTVTEHVECRIEDMVTLEKSQCLGCPVEIDEDSEDLKAPLSLSISKYNTESDHTHLFTLQQVGPATRQVVAGLRFKVIFDMRRSNCSKAEHNELHDLCVADNDNVELAHCSSTVDIAPWRREPPSVHNECGPGALPATVLTRRRPPGWSPLRTMILQNHTSSSRTPGSDTSVTPSKASTTNEESSEEDAGLAKPSLSPDALPFHCPTKPWKAFIPVHAGSVATEATPTLTPVDGAFSNLDLLG